MTVAYSFLSLVLNLSAAGAMPRPVMQPNCADHFLFNGVQSLDLHAMKESILLPEIFHSHPSGITLVSDKAFAVQERRYNMVTINGRNSKIDEVVNPTTLLSALNGQRLISDTQLLIRVNEYLTKNGSQKAVSLDGYSTKLINQLNLIAFTARLAEGGAMAFSFNFLTNELRWLYTMARPTSELPLLQSFHDRFLTFTELSDQDDTHATIHLLDLITGRRILLDVPVTQQLKLSADGTRILLYGPSGRDSQREDGSLYALVDKWSYKPNEIYNPLDLAELALVPGSPVAANRDLTRVLMNRNSQNDLPDLAVFEFIGAHPLPRIVELKGWNNIVTNLHQESAKGLRFVRHDLSAEFSPMGDDLMVNVAMNWFKGDRDPLSLPLPHRAENWVIVWPFEGKNGGHPWQIKSKDFNVANDMEVHGFIHRLDGPILWPRKFASRFLPDGRVILVRAVAHELARETRLSRVMVKARVVDINTDARIDYHYTLSPVKLDPMNANGTHAGITTLEIAPHGHSVMLHITGHGMVLLSLNGHSRDYSL